MDITDQGRTAIQSGANAIEHAAHHVKRGTDKLADAAGDATEHAVRSARHAGREINSFVHRRPVETALLSAATACLITGLAFWFTRRD